MTLIAAVKELHSLLPGNGDIWTLAEFWWVSYFFVFCPFFFWQPWVFRPSCWSCHFIWMTIMEYHTFIKITLLLSLQAINSNFSKIFLHNFNENGVLTLSLTFSRLRTFTHFSPNNLWQHRRVNLQRHQILQFPTNLQNCKNIKMPKVVRMLRNVAIFC